MPGIETFDARKSLLHVFAHPHQGKRAIAFILLAIILRIPTFYPVVIDHDESTYLIIADLWLQGHLPYRYFLDVKPPGIYMIFALALWLWRSVWVVRLLAAVSIGLAAYFLQRSYRHFSGTTSGSVSAGILFVFMSSLHKWGWSANTEIFFVTFGLAGLFLWMRKETRWMALLAGILFGTGFIIKYHIVFDVLVFVVLYWLRYGPTMRQSMVRLLVLALGFIIPPTCVILHYAHAGALQELYFATLEIPSRYASDFNALKALSFIAEYYLSFLPLTLVALFSSYRWYQSKHHRTGLLWMIGWLMISWTAIMITGKLYFHYLFQAVASLAVLTATYGVVIEKRSSWLNWIIKRPWPVLISITLMCWINQYIQVLSKPEPTRKIAEMINSDLLQNSYLYTNDRNILYFLCHTKPPTPYVHTSLLYKPDLIEAYQIDVPAAFNQIIEKKPLYYIFRTKIPLPFETEIIQSYELLHTFSPDIKVYKRIASNN